METTKIPIQCTDLRYTYIQKNNVVSTPNMKTKIVSFIPHKYNCGHKLKKNT